MRLSGMEWSSMDNNERGHEHNIPNFTKNELLASLKLSKTIHSQTILITFLRSANRLSSNLISDPKDVPSC